jgi:hypothetical protein
MVRAGRFIVALFLFMASRMFSKFGCTFMVWPLPSRIIRPRAEISPEATALGGFPIGVDRPSKRLLSKYPTSSKGLRSLVKDRALGKGVLRSFLIAEARVAIILL